MDRAQYDVFVSYASEDAAVAVAIARAIADYGLRVWLDKVILTVGDSLRRTIDHGLANSRYAAILLSPHFLSKSWPQRELDGLVAREMIEGRRIILPIWHDIDAPQIARYSPPLADKLGLATTQGVPTIAKHIASLCGVSILPTSRQPSEIADSRGYRYETIDFSASVRDFGVDWSVRWNVRIAAERDGIPGVYISYRVDDLIRESLADHVENDDVTLEHRAATHPRSIECYFRFRDELDRGQVRDLCYVRRFRKRCPPQTADLFVTKVSSYCDRLSMGVRFDEPPGQVSYRVTDRGESLLFQNDPIALGKTDATVTRDIILPDQSLTYGFYWQYSSENREKGAEP
ncbi:MAG TPA: toll/interleukin-1 receptor domain-containing protein [Kiritimatiellia bacterium]|nr:toll/interleukin-1 receptor domain-containing protein [Saprospiraceae bacterium]HMP00663.1 toll/interleukin-1 receptor domain-containing protein [Kiritimatiellia bacterium]